MPGCLDYTFLKDVVDPDSPAEPDTGSPPPEPIFEQECFDPFELYQGDATPGNGWTDYTQGACIANGDPSSGSAWVRVGARELNSYWLISDTEIDRDGAAARLLAANFGYSSGWDDSRNYRSDDTTVVGSGPWRADGAEGTVDALNACFPNCRLLFYGEVVDPDRAPVAGACEAYDPTSLCVEWKYYDTARRVPIYSSCTPGSGTFALVPRRAVDRDEDTYLSTTLAPIMLSGTGEMTAAAWITSAEVVEDEGQPLRVIKSGARYLFDEDDALVNPSLVSKAVAATGVTNFNVGVVNGATRFILQEAPPTMPVDLEVELAWECGDLEPTPFTPCPGGTILRPIRLWTT